MSIYDFARREFEKQYDSMMTVWTNEPKKVGSITKPVWAPVSDLMDIPCRISRKQITPQGEGEYAGSDYPLSLYCSPTLEIAPGSRIAITDVHGHTRNYTRASEGFSSYRTHQEFTIVREVIA